MRSPGRFLIFAFIVLILDLYAYQGFRTIISNFNVKLRTALSTGYWVISALTFLTIVIFAVTSFDFLSYRARNYIFAILVGVFLAKFIAVVFVLLDDIIRLVRWIILRFQRPSAVEVAEEKAAAISRSKFLGWMGVGIGTAVFGGLIEGFANTYNYHVRRVKIAFPNLPASFRGLRIVQISDIHSGSLFNQKGVEKGVQRILDEKPDLILFTGDLVNEETKEIELLKNTFAKLKAPLGVFSVLGNHDYGDYKNWPDIDGKMKQQNFQEMLQTHKDMGWQLLMNQHVIFERGGDKIALIGIENWGGRANFPKYGRMDLAYPGTESILFKILMSHDPSHWDLQVRPQYPDIDLMLSGHTHGMQFGIEIPGLRWSPVQYVYKQWAGLYEQGRQKLYVNRGFGVLGYPGRVGIMPEITVLELV